jgi:leucyl aminopeptidase
LVFDKSADSDQIQAAVEGYLLGSFKMLDYKSGKDKEDKAKLSEIVILVDSRGKVNKAEAAVKRGEIIAEGQLMVRRLATMPSNDLTPQSYARKMQELARKDKVECQILDETAIRKEKMGLVEAVAKGSQEPPRFVILKYRGAAAGVKPIVLVGKGVTFDSGGISLKPAQDMHEMKGDMTGSAVVLATILTAARLKIKQNVVALMPLVENMPSGHAQKPGDIAVSRKGLTVEIINTDAEGRLILADALDYANKFNPQAVIDIATLTGAALFVLGYAGAPVLGNRKALMDQLRAASKNTAEAIWEMPIWDDHREAMKSSLADLVNSGGRPAGTITATAFLENFIGDWPWAHIDIAYVDVEPKGKPYIPKGATGIGLRLLVDLLINWKRF